MLKLIHADLYKVFHRTYFYILTLIVAALSLVIVFALHGSAQSSKVSVAFQFAFQYVSLAVMILPCLTDIVLNEDFREHTMKNTLSYGTGRLALYASKMVASIILGVLMMAVVLAVYVGGSMVVLSHDAGLTSTFVNEFMMRMGTAGVVFIASLAMASFFSTLFHHNSLWIVFFYGGFFFTDLLLKLFRLSGAVPYLLKSQLTVASGQPVDQLLKAVVISLVTLVVFFAAGAEIFCKKDIC
ncbi:MAG: ABC transporter permease [Oscillospiraceae bacterium]|jgi:hypothetical protein|nr:ABC transporter permease [Oscillospiraceae bacterium]